MSGIIRICALDFDGIVLESVGVKLAAFERLFGDEPLSSHIAAYFRQNNGLDRYTKFRHVWTAILGRDYNASVEARLDAQFSRMVMDEVVRCPFVPGAEDFLRGCCIPLYVVSAMPLRDLRVIVERRNLNGLFKGLYGSPGRKQDQLRDIIAREGIEAGWLVFVGDSPKDMAAAREAGARFVGRRNIEQFGLDAPPLLDDLRGLPAALAAMEFAPERGV